MTRTNRSRQVAGSPEHRLRIVRFTVIGYKRVEGLEINAKGEAIILNGDNNQGKSSIIEGFKNLMMGGDFNLKEPIHRGADAAKLVAELGQGEQAEYIVTKVFTPDKQPTLKVDTADGGRREPPQTVLNGLIGPRSLDVQAYERLTPKGRRDVLAGLVEMEEDPALLDAQNLKDYETRRDLNRDADRLRGQAAGIEVPADLPAEKVDVAAARARLQEAIAANQALEREREARQRSRREAAEARRIGRQEAERAETLRQELAEAEQAAVSYEQQAIALNKALDDAPPIADPADTDALLEEIGQADQTNRWIDERTRLAGIVAEAAGFEKRAEELTAAMADRTARKLQAIANAKYPIPGLGLEELEGDPAKDRDKDITFHSIPWSQIGAGEQLEISAEIAMAQPSSVDVLLIKDGNRLDEERRQRLLDKFEGRGFQVMMELVGEGDGTGFVIYDGALKSSPVRKRGDPPAQSSFALGDE